MPELIRFISNCIRHWFTNVMPKDTVVDCNVLSNYIDEALP